MRWITTLLAARRLRKSPALFVTQSGGDPDPSKRTASVQLQFFGPNALKDCECAANDLLAIVSQ